MASQADKILAKYGLTYDDIDRLHNQGSPSAAPSAPDQNDSFLGDFVDVTQRGASQGVAGLFSLAEEFTGYGESGADFFNRIADEQLDTLTPEAKEALAKELFTRNEQGELVAGEGLTDWRTLGLNIGQGVGTIAPSLLGGGVGGLAGRALLAKRGVDAANKAATVGRTAGFTGVGGGMAQGAAGNEAFEAVKAMDREMLYNSDSFLELWNSDFYDENLSAEDNAERVVSELADEARSQVMRDPELAAVNFASNAVMGKVFDGLVKGALGKSRLLNSGLAGTSEATEEFAQEGMSALTVNEALRNIDPTITDDNVLPQALTGAVVGFGVGSPLGLAGRVDAAREKAKAEGKGPIEQELDSSAELGAELSAASAEIDPIAQAQAEAATANQTAADAVFGGRDPVTAPTEPQGFTNYDQPPTPASAMDRPVRPTMDERESTARRRKAERLDGETFTAAIRTLRDTGDEEGAATLETARDIARRADVLERSGKADMAAKLRQSALQMYTDVMGVEPEPAPEKGGLPAEVNRSVEGEVLPDTKLATTEQRQQGETFDGELQYELPGTDGQPGLEQNSAPRIAPSNTIYGQEPGDVRERREQKQAANRQALEGNFPNYDPSRIDRVKEDRALRSAQDRESRLEPVIEDTPTPTLDQVRSQGLDDRLADEVYRERINKMAGELERGGAIAYVRDDNDRIKGKTKSQNPQWFQDQEGELGDVVYVRKTVQRALNGDKLTGERQKRVISTMLDAIEDERAAQSDPDKVAEWESLLDEAQFRASVDPADPTPMDAWVPIPDASLFGDGTNAPLRTIATLWDEALAVGVTQDQLEAIDQESTTSEQLAEGIFDAIRRQTQGYAQADPGRDNGRRGADQAAPSETASGVQGEAGGRAAEAETAGLNPEQPIDDATQELTESPEAEGDSTDAAPQVDTPDSATPTLTKSGKPFKSEKMALASAKRDGIANPKAVPVEGGFGYVPGDAATPNSTDPKQTDSVKPESSVLPNTELPAGNTEFSDGDTNADTLIERGGDVGRVGAAYKRAQSRGPVTTEQAATIRQAFSGEQGMAELEAIAAEHGDKSPAQLMDIVIERGLAEPKTASDTAQPVTWEKAGKSRWNGNLGHKILKYRMGDDYSYLLYQPGESLEGGDYTTHNSLSDAKAAATESDFQLNTQTEQDLNAKAERDEIEVGAISPELAEKIGRQAAPIILNDGDDSYGRIHIEARRGESLKKLGYTVDEFVSEVAGKFNQVFRTPGGQILLARVNGRDKIAFIQLSPGESGDFYRVNSAFAVGKRYLAGHLRRENYEMLWDGTEQPSETSSEPPAFAQSPDSQAGQGTPSVPRHSRAIVDPKDSEGQVDTPAGKIDDFGETLQGARKHTAIKLGESLSDDTIDVAAEPLSKSFPQPNYKKLAEEGVDGYSLALVALLRDQIPNKPRRGWKLKRWAEDVEKKRKIAKEIIEQGENFTANWRMIDEFSDVDIMATAEAIKDIPAADLPKAAKYKIASGNFSMANGVKYEPAKSLWFIKGPNDRRLNSSQGAIDFVESEAEAVAAAQEIIPKLIASDSGSNKPRSKYTNIGLYRDRLKKDYYIAFKVRSSVVRVKGGFDDPAAAREYIAENRDEIQAKIDAMRKGPNMRGAENTPRKGDDLREGDISPDDFSDAFGFRGVQFGNYVEGKRRQADLNRAYDALMDLADAIGVPPKALSLNGSLGLAFGARGRGGAKPAAAHYEPSTVVINLTKNAGPGSLAHEWLHALDNYFAKQDESGDFISRTKVAGGGARKEVFDAWKKVEQALLGGEFSKRSAEFDAARSKPYWNTTIEKAARAFERYMVDRLGEKGVVNDYLANIDMTGGAYPTAEEMQSEGIRDAFDNLFNVIESKETEKGVMLFSRNSEVAADAKPKGVSKGAARIAVNQFLKQYKGANDVKVEIHDSYSAAFGEEAEFRTKGGYSPATDTLYLFTSEFDGVADLRETLQHEILVHKGLGFVEPELLQSFLGSIRSTAKDSPELARIVAEVESVEGDRSEAVQAEEILARIAQERLSLPDKLWNRLVLAVQRLLRKMGLNVESSARRRGKDLIYRIGDAFAEGKRARRRDMNGLLNSRTGGWDGFPDAVIAHRSVSDHPDYEAAKRGDNDAALRLAEDRVTDEYAERVAAAIDSAEAKVSPVLAVEAAGRNKIPLAVASVLADKLGLEVDTEILQTSKVSRGGSGGFHRLANQPEFDGEVEARDYIILDDTLAQGGTLAQLKEHIESRGGRVILATALTGKDYSAKIAVDPDMLSEVRERHEPLEPWFASVFGYDFSGLTQSEARYIVNSGASSDELRNRLIEARDAGSRELFPEEAGGQAAEQPSITPIFYSRTAEASPERAAVMEKIGLAPDTRSISARIKDTIKETWQDIKETFIPAVVDKFHDLNRINKDAYMRARMSTNTGATIAAALGHATPEWHESGILKAKENSKGLLDILKTVEGDTNDWLGWMVGKRAEQLAAEGRENLLSEADIAELLNVTPEQAERFQKTADEWREYNNAMLDLMVGGGLMKAEAAERFKQDQYYIPFYREIQDETGEIDVAAPFAKRGLSHQSDGIEMLKGGTSNLQDPLKNMLMNVSRAIDVSVKNNALQRIVDQVGGNTDILVPAAEGNRAGKNVIRVKRGGESEYYRVKDAGILGALTAMGDVEVNALTKALGMPKRLLTAGVTATPTFMIRNAIRDITAAWMQSEDVKYQAGKAMGHFKAALKIDDDLVDLMMAGGAFMGGYRYSNDATSNAQALREQLRAKGMSTEAIDGYMSSLWDGSKRKWEWYREKGERFENMSRLKLFKDAKDQGLDYFEAAYRAKDLMDFSLHGRHQIMHFLIQTVPFLNARLMGLYKLGRVFGNQKNMAELRQMVAFRGAMLTAASLALYAMNEDDERYQELQEWDKDANWHFFFDDEHIRVPKPFELGLIFSTIPERAARLAAGDDDARTFFRSLGTNITETLSMNPIPQAAMPLMEASLNYDTFRRRSIDNLSDQGNLPESRFSNYTSELAKAMGAGMAALGYEGDMASPKRIDHVIKGYTGSMGIALLNGVDGVIHLMNGKTMPAMNQRDYPVVGWFARGNDPASTKYSEEFYTLLSRANKAYRTYRDPNTDTEKREDILEEYSSELRTRKMLGKTSRRLNQLRKQIDVVYRDETMSREQKRERINRLQSMMNEMQRRAVETTERVGG